TCCTASRAKSSRPRVSAPSEKTQRFAWYCCKRSTSTRRASGRHGRTSPGKTTSSERELEWPHTERYRTSFSAVTASCRNSPATEDERRLRNVSRGSRHRSPRRRASRDCHEDRRPRATAGPRDCTRGEHTRDLDPPGSGHGHSSHDCGRVHRGGKSHRGPTQALARLKNPSDSQRPVVTVQPTNVRQTPASCLHLRHPLCAAVGERPWPASRYWREARHGFRASAPPR